MKITGQILKENRERKGATLNEVSLSTKITIKTLIAIENGDPINLPPKTFLRGFVRSYAVFLGVDVEEILKTFQEEMGSTLSRPAGAGPNPSELNAAATEAVSDTETATTPASKESSPAPAAAAPTRAPKRIDAEATLRDEPSMMTRGGIVGGILLLVVLIVFLKGKMDSYESERATGPADPTKVETVAPVPDGAVTAEEAAVGAAAAEEQQDGDDSGPVASTTKANVGITATPTPSPAASPSPAPTAAPTAAPAPKASPSPTATPVASATPKPSPSATPKPSPSATPKATPTPKPSPSATPSPSPKPSPSATPGATPSATPGATATPKPAAAAAAGKSHEILIEALDSVDVEVTVDGEAPRMIKLRGEQVQSIKVKRKAILKMSDGGAVNLIVNGVDRGVPGDLGKPTRIELP